MWQTIDKAPKDGTVIDLIINGERNPACAWIESKKSWCFRLYSTGGQRYGWYKVNGNPTHFMFIPEFP